MIIQFKNRITVITIVVFFILLNFSENAYAYLDPGSGSYIFQLLMACLFGMLFVIKNFLKKIIYFFKKLFTKKGEDNG